MSLNNIQILLQVLAVVAGVLVAIVTTVLAANIIHWFRQLDPKERVKGGRPPKKQPRVLWIVFWTCLAVLVVLPIVNWQIDDAVTGGPEQELEAADVGLLPVTSIAFWRNFLASMWRMSLLDPMLAEPRHPHLALCHSR